MDLRTIGPVGGATFTNANFSGANLAGAYLKSANFTGANLTKANLSGACLCTSGAVGTIPTNLTQAILTSANLSGADLSGALLNSASAQYADMSGMTTYYTSFVGGYFNSVNFQGTDLSYSTWGTDAVTGLNSRVGNANFTGATSQFLTNFFKSGYNTSTICPNGSNAVSGVSPFCVGGFYAP
jgi:uncharacterized protein YjbI with pentapeptide repeats